LGHRRPIPADALYQHFLVTAERRFWRCVQTGDTPRPYGIEPTRRGSKGFSGPSRRGVIVRIVLDPRECHDFAKLGELSDNVRNRHRRRLGL
jgi:hypothetical protein